MMFFDLFRREPNIRDLNAGEILFSVGEEGEHMYVLVAGRADIMVHGRVVEEAEVGAILGEMALIEKAPRSATVVARSNCRFAVIDKKRFHYLVSEAPHFAIEVMRVLAHRLRNTDTLLPA